MEQIDVSMEMDRHHNQTSRYLYDIGKLINREMTGRMTSEDGDLIIKQLIAIRKPENEIEFLHSVKNSISNISRILIDAILEYELNLGNNINVLRLDSRIDEKLTIQQLIKKMNISRPTYYNWVKKGLQTIRIEGRVFISQSDLNNFLQNYKED